MNLFSPKEIVEIANKQALNKASYSTNKVMVLSFMAGAYIAFGGLLSIVVGGGMPRVAAENPGIVKLIFGACFPIGLMMVVLAGAELFTGNNAYFMPNVLSGKQSWLAPLRNWGLVYVGNFLGAVFVAFVIAYLTQIVHQSPWIDFVTKIGITKTSQPFYVVFVKGIGANWLVCLALWMGMSAKQTNGKILAIWWPVMAFVAMGFEHSIANMFFIPLAIFEGADISWIDFGLKNLLPATLGNIVGGAFFVGTLYWYVFDKK